MARFLSSDPPPLRLARALESPRRMPRSYALPWAITLTAMLVLAVASWVFSLYVFGHPEEPLPHRVLRALRRLDPPQRFDVYAVPGGRGLGAEDAYAKYRKLLSLGPAAVSALNARLLREYLTNYRRADPVDFLSGTFRIVALAPLHQGTFLPQGLAVRAQSLENDDLEIEYLMPGPEPQPGMFHIGEEIRLEAGRAYAAVVQCTPLGGQRLCLSLIPLVYAPHQPAEGDVIELEPPVATNPAAAWPAYAQTPE